MELLLSNRLRAGCLTYIVSFSVVCNKAFPGPLGGQRRQSLLWAPWKTRVLFPWAGVQVFMTVSGLLPCLRFRSLGVLGAGSMVTLGPTLGPADI